MTQTLSTDLYPDPNDEHLSPVAAKMILAALAQHIQRVLLAHAQETQYPLEVEAITFSERSPLLRAKTQ